MVLVGSAWRSTPPRASVVVRGKEGDCSVASPRPSPAQVGADQRILTARLELQPVVELTPRRWPGCSWTSGCTCSPVASQARWTTSGPLSDASRHSASTIGTGRHSATGRCAAGPTGMRWGWCRRWLPIVAAAPRSPGRSGCRGRGQGIASEAALAVVAWLEAHGVRTITAHINPDHHASVGVATQVGLHPHRRGPRAAGDRRAAVAARADVDATVRAGN
jgi:Acetyltransferase (GNAT) domain